jgi:hypothetical protein
MNRFASAAAKLPESERKKLAVQALAGSETISDLAARLGVSRKFVYEQRGKASDALNDAFPSAVVDDDVLFQLPVAYSGERDRSFRPIVTAAHEMVLRG